MKFKNIIFNIICIFVLSSLDLNIFAREGNPPLAPPSKLALSLDEMILHFKVFVIADIYQRIISLKGESLEDSFTFNDLELNILINDAISKAPLLSQTKPLEVFFLNQNLYIHLENTYFLCYLLEVIPGHFDLKTEPISEGEYNKIISMRNSENKDNNK